MSSTLDPQRTIAELKELRSLTSDDNGAQRVAFTPTCAKARKFLREKIAEIPDIEMHNDEAGNFWATLPGKIDKALLIGGHIDSVPNGGWLDGCLNTLAGVEVLRRIKSQGTPPPVTVRLVDWCDEEGARFGKSLFGSSAASGKIDMEQTRQLKDKDGVRLVDAVKEFGIDFENVRDAGKELKNAAAYQELHIEQGPVLLDLDLPLGTVLGTFGVERHAITFRGQAAHSGSTPMNRRRDAFLAAAKMAAEIYEIAKRSGHGVCTIGSCLTKPGIVTSVVEECRITLDQRHLDADALARMLSEAKTASKKFAREGDVDLAWERIWNIEPILFHNELVDLCDEAIRETGAKPHRLPSGPLHDAAEVARAGVPTIMMFVQSLHGISHNKIEDTREEHLASAVTAFDKLADKIMAWIARN